MFIPEKDLLVAVLDRAALDYHGNNADLKEVAREWIYDTKDKSHSFCFEWVCSHLDLNPLLVRERISELSLDSSVSQRQRWLRKKIRNAETKELFEKVNPKANRSSARSIAA